MGAKADQGLSPVDTNSITHHGVRDGFSVPVCILDQIYKVEPIPTESSSGSGGKIKV